MLAWLFIWGSFAMDTRAQNLEPSINISGNLLDFNVEFPFVDRMRYPSNWLVGYIPFQAGDPNNLNQYSLFQFDEQGYPLRAPIRLAGQRPITVRMRLIDRLALYKPQGRWVVLYDGEGTLSVGGYPKLNETPGRFEIEVNDIDRTMDLRIDSSRQGNHIRNIRVLIPGSEAIYRQQLFNPVYLNKLRNFTSIRYMDGLETNNSPIRTWNERGKPFHIGHREWAFEDIIALSNATCTDAWVCVPHQADSTFIAEMAKLFLDKLNTGLKVYIEYSNEVWNTDFGQVAWVASNTPGTYTGDVTTQRAQRNAWQFARVFRIWRQIWGSQANRVVRVAATQGTNTFYTERLLDALGPNGADAVAIAAYVNPFVFESEMTPALTVDQLFNFGFRAIRERLGPRWRSVADLAIARGMKPIMYEGGQHFWQFSFTASTPYVPVVLAAQTHPRMGDLYQELFDTLRATRYQMFSQFVLASNTGASGTSFGALRGIEQTESQSPKWAEIIKLLPAYLGAGGSRPTCSGASADVTGPSVPFLQGEPGTNPGEIRLQWADATRNWPLPYDNVSVTGFDIIAGTTVLASVSSTTSTRVLTGLVGGQLYRLRVVARDAAGNRTASNEVAVTATPDVPTFNIAANPVTVAVQRGTSATTTLTLTPLFGYSSATTFAVTGLPAGVTATWSANPITGSNTILTLSASTSATLGGATLTVTATGGGTIRSLSLALNVTDTPPPPDFTLSISSSTVQVQAGGPNQQATVTVNGTNGFSAAVNLSASGLPPGVTAQFAPPSLSGSGTATISVSASTAATPGTYATSVVATAGGLTRTVPLTVEVLPPAAADYVISVQPAAVVLPAGGSVSTTLTQTGVNGFAGSTSFSVTNLPAGVMAQFAPANVAGSGSTVLTLTADTTATSGTYATTVSATDGAAFRTTPLEIRIEPAAAGAAGEVRPRKVFTPNGDGQNDTWVVDRPAFDTQVRVRVFNRNGVEVYRSDNYLNDWDGSYRGAPLAADAYFYLVQSGGKTLRGSVTIVR